MLMSVFSLLGNPVIVTLLSSTENRVGHTRREGHTHFPQPRRERSGKKIRKLKKHKTWEAADNPRKSKSHLNGNQWWLKGLPCNQPRRERVLVSVHLENESTRWSMLVQWFTVIAFPPPWLTSNAGSVSLSVMITNRVWFKRQTPH